MTPHPTAEAALPAATPAPAAGAGPSFYESVPVFDGFGRILDPTVYAPVPDDWVIGITDVVASTAAIEAGLYRTVNTAGATAIAAMSNALSGEDFPFVFGGDGASFAVPAEHAALARETLAATAAFVRDELDLTLRAALVPVAAARAAGRDVRIGRFAASDQISYAMFSGGGLAWAEREMKAGRFAVAPAGPGVQPNLFGLSCRFSEMPAVEGLIASLIVVPTGGAADPGYRRLVEDVLALADVGGTVRRPLPDTGPPLAWPPKGLGLEMLTRRRQGEWRLWSGLKAIIATLFGHLVFRFRIPIGPFDPDRYMGDLVANSDFRKFDDGLRLTVDCSPAVADALEARLDEAAAAGIARYGLHRQTASVMTCFVPSALVRDHVHFVDGASGGYAAAAAALKGKG